MKKNVLCTALAVTMMLTTTASATAKPWWLSKYRVTFDNELGIVGNVTLCSLCEIDVHFRHKYLTQKTLRRHQKYTRKLPKIKIDAQKSEDYCS